jgi:hypothetical protein
MAKQIEFISLFDYLGKAAGSQLGKEVAEIASEMGIPRKVRAVETSTYEGLIMLYPKKFLEVYFEKIKV